MDLFQTKYLDFNLYAVSLFWVRVDHCLLSKQIYKNQSQFQQVIRRMWKDFWEPVKSSCEKRLQIFFNYEARKKIFGKYLHHKGLHWEKCYFLLLYSARSDCSTHQISCFSDQPFMFFFCANIWPIFDKYLEKIFFL